MEDKELQEQLKTALFQYTFYDVGSELYSGVVMGGSYMAVENSKIELGGNPITDGLVTDTISYDTPALGKGLFELPGHKRVIDPETKNRLAAALVKRTETAAVGLTKMFMLEANDEAYVMQGHEFWGDFFILLRPQQKT